MIYQYDFVVMELFITLVCENKCTKALNRWTSVLHLDEKIGSLKLYGVSVFIDTSSARYIILEQCRIVLALRNTPSV